MSQLPEQNAASKVDACSAPQPGTQCLRPPIRKARPWMLIAAGVVALVSVTFWGPIQRKYTAYLLLRAEAPSEEILTDIVEHSSDAGGFLTRLWGTQKVPHRQFVMGYLGRIANTKPELFSRNESLVLEATGDPDVEVRQLAFAPLERLKHSQLRRASLEQLSDADPAVRLLGLQGLRRIAGSNDVAIAVPFLKDSEPRVQVAAAQVLRQATGQDFGIKASHALPQFTGIDTNPPPAPDLQAIAQGLKLWDQWWAAHKSEYPELMAQVQTFPRAVSLPTADFKLQDIDAKPVQLAQFSGKTVLLLFWGPGAPASLDDVTALNSLYARHAGRLAILGICIPAGPSCADEHEHGHGNSEGAGQDHAQHQHNGNPATPKSPEEFLQFSQQAAQKLKIQFPMLVDPEGNIGSRFKVEERPTYVLIDPQGRVRRRFVGFRSERALTEILEEPASGAETAQPKKVQKL